MKHSIIALALVGAAMARPAAMMKKREVPQEHSHENIVRAVNVLLQQNNPDNIQDAVFGLLGAKAAAAGQGKIADVDCLQQATADQAFTNAKAAGDVAGMTNALVFRALERNTGSVGLASVACTSIKAVNPEIAALQQHQDPAGDGAQALNKQIAEELARQIAAVGGDPTLANEASTFAPGKVGDPTGAGNSCDVADDAAGCINSQKLRVDDLSADEIAAAVAGAGANVAGAANATAAANGTANANDQAADCKAAGKGKAGKGKGKAAKDKAAKDKAAADKAAADKAAADKAAAGNDKAAAGNDKAAAAGGAADFGGCNLAISFGIPSDGRKEDAFEAVDLATFNHGSALNIAVISNFICSQVGSKCNANAAAISACDAAASAANGLKGQAAADAFNSALGL